MNLGGSKDFTTTLPKFNSEFSPEKLPGPNRKVVFHSPFFFGYVKLRGCNWFIGSFYWKAGLPFRKQILNENERRNFWGGFTWNFLSGNSLVEVSFSGGGWGDFHSEYIAYGLLCQAILDTDSNVSQAQLRASHWSFQTRLIWLTRVWGCYLRGFLRWVLSRNLTFFSRWFQETCIF